MGLIRIFFIGHGSPTTFCGIVTIDNDARKAESSVTSVPPRPGAGLRLHLRLRRGGVQTR